MSDAFPLSAADLRARFDAPDPLTIGLEEEAMLLDPETFDLAPRAGELLRLVDGDRRFKPELPAAHVELMTDPAETPAAAVAQLAAARRDLVAAAGGLAHLGAAGVHPFSAVEGTLSAGPRYDRMPREYGFTARRQLVASLQVHVAVGGAERTLAVYNALRSFLPEIAALAANASFYEGRDSGMASVRPQICALLPRQGMPPAIESWEQFAAWLEWGARSGTVADPGFWWWELRPHVRHGTLEVRVPDAQATVEDAAAVAGFVHRLVRWLRDQSGELRVHETWQIEENRWSAARHGLDGFLVDLDSGERVPTRERLTGLVEMLGASEVRTLLEHPAPDRQRAVGDARAVAQWLARVYPPA